jgi:regulator of cell morphogenesis and NO signaling
MVDRAQLMTMTVNEAIRRFPAMVAVFTNYGIDACCGGALPIGEAAQRHGVPLDALLDRLERTVGPAAA